jgi:hypothetical protein
MSGRYSKLHLALDIAQRQAREATIENNSLSCALEDYKRDFPILEARAEKAEAENARLRERLEAALDKIADIQENDNREKADGVCYACGICSGIPDEWQPTDDHCCREILDLWSNGEPLPWAEAARRAVEGK